MQEGGFLRAPAECAPSFLDCACARAWLPARAGGEGPRRGVGTALSGRILRTPVNVAAPRLLLVKDIALVNINQFTLYPEPRRLCDCSPRFRGEQSTHVVPTKLLPGREIPADQPASQPRELVVMRPAARPRPRAGRPPTSPALPVLRPPGPGTCVVPRHPREGRPSGQGTQIPRTE